MESGLHFIRQRVPHPLSMLGKRFHQLAAQAVQEPVKLFSPTHVFARGNETHTYCTKRNKHVLTRATRVVSEPLSRCGLHVTAISHSQTPQDLFFFSFRAKPIMSWRCKKPNVCLNFIKKVNNCICDSPGRLIVSPLVNWDNVNDCILARLKWSQGLQLIAVITTAVASWFFGGWGVGMGGGFSFPTCCHYLQTKNFLDAPLERERERVLFFISPRMLMIKQPATTAVLSSAFWMMYDSGFPWTSFKLDLDAAN